MTKDALLARTLLADFRTLSKVDLFQYGLNEYGKKWDQMCADALGWEFVAAMYKEIALNHKPLDAKTKTIIERLIAALQYGMSVDNDAVNQLLIFCRLRYSGISLPQLTFCLHEVLNDEDFSRIVSMYAEILQTACVKEYSDALFKHIKARSRKDFLEGFVI